MPRKIFLIACEASGDSHGAELLRELKKIDPEVACLGLGGPQMRAAGMSLLKDMTEISALGLGDVLRRYFLYRKIFYEALEALERFQPDALILIDSPAFNLRFAKKIRKRVPVLYYISPQIWAWGARRIETIKKTVDKMLVILPFETPLYEEAGIPCEFVGHPALDWVKTFASREELRRSFGIRSDQIAVGLIPGSRTPEVKRILPIMLESARLLRREMPETTFFLCPAPNVPPAIYESILQKFPLTPTLSPVGRGKGEGKTAFYDLVATVDFALVASGTATLETALLGTPFFLLYKASWSTYLLGKRLIRVPYLGLVNLLAGKEVVPEFIQRDAHPETIAHEAKTLLQNQELYARMKEEFLKVREGLGEEGASKRAAESILKMLPGKLRSDKRPVAER